MSAKSIAGKILGGLVKGAEVVGKAYEKKGKREILERKLTQLCEDLGLDVPQDDIDHAAWTLSINDRS